MKQPGILVTGAGGQLGRELQSLAAEFPRFHFYFLSKEELPVDDRQALNQFFSINSPMFCINCAAYTAVDKAESDAESCYRINRDAVALLASVCRERDTKLLHISTDYVFNGQSSIPYKEDDDTEPANVYGRSKLQGEMAALGHLPGAIIIRTAWVYSVFGSNFVKTMLRLMEERPSINVVNDQTGAPTYAADLARLCLSIINEEKWTPGIYHYTNEGRITWYDFAVAIKEITGSPCMIHPVSSDSYPTAARRPVFSLLDTDKIKNTFAISIPGWRESLQQCLRQLNAAAKE